MSLSSPPPFPPPVLMSLDPAHSMMQMPNPVVPLQWLKVLACISFQSLDVTEPVCKYVICPFI